MCNTGKLDKLICVERAFTCNGEEVLGESDYKKDVFMSVMLTNMFLSAAQSKLILSDAHKYEHVRKV